MRESVHYCSNELATSHWNGTARRGKTQMAEPFLFIWGPPMPSICLLHLSCGISLSFLHILYSIKDNNIFIPIGKISTDHPVLTWASGLPDRSLAFSINLAIRSESAGIFVSARVSPVASLTAHKLYYS